MKLQIELTREQVYESMRQYLAADSEWWDDWVREIEGVLDAELTVVAGIARRALAVAIMKKLWQKPDDHYAAVAEEITAENEERIAAGLATR